MDLAQATDPAPDPIEEKGRGGRSDSRSGEWRGAGGKGCGLQLRMGRKLKGVPGKWELRQHKQVTRTQARAGRAGRRQVLIHSQSIHSQSIHSQSIHRQSLQSQSTPVSRAALGGKDWLRAAHSDQAGMG